MRLSGLRPCLEAVRRVPHRQEVLRREHLGHRIYWHKRKPTTVLATRCSLIVRPSGRTSPSRMVCQVDPVLALKRLLASERPLVTIPFSKGR